MKMKSDPYRLRKIKGEPVYKWQKENGHQGEDPRLSSKMKLNSSTTILSLGVYEYTKTEDG